jgi:hypothetical protein
MQYNSSEHSKLTTSISSSVFFFVKQIVDVSLTDNDGIQVDVDITNSVDTFQVVSGSFILSWFQILNSHCAFFTHLTNSIVRNSF